MKISFHIFFGAHETAKDFEKLKQAFKQADVYIPESFMWNDEYLWNFNRLSQKKITPCQMIQRCFLEKNSSWHREFRVIYGSRKPILLADVPEWHSLVDEYDKSDRLYDESFDLFKKGDFNSALKTVRKYVEFNADFLLKRDRQIKRNLKGSIAEIIKKIPKFKNRKEVKVLIILGSFHTLLYHNLKKQKSSTSCQFASKPDVFSSLDEAGRRTIFLKDKKIDDILFARSMAEELLEDCLDKITDDTNKAIMIGRKICSKLNLKDIAEMSKELGRGDRRTIVSCLRKRGIKIPKTEKEIDKMLEIRPVISYCIFYSYHVKAKDFQGLKRAFDKADIYVPEMLGWMPKDYREYNELSQGKLTPKKLAQKYKTDTNSHFFKQYQIIYKSKKPILCVDVPAGHKLLNMSNKGDELSKEAWKLFIKGMFEQAIAKMREHIMCEAAFEMKREEIIKKNLKEQIRNLIKTHPKLKTKHVIRVLLSLGAGHTRVYRDLKKEKLLISWHFPHQLQVFDSIAQARRMVMFRKGKKLNKTLIARGIAETLFFSFLIDGAEYDSNELTAVLRKMCSRLKLKDVENISKKFKKDIKTAVVDTVNTLEGIVLKSQNKK